MKETNMKCTITTQLLKPCLFEESRSLGNVYRNVEILKTPHFAMLPSPKCVKDHLSTDTKDNIYAI